MLVCAGLDPSGRAGALADLWAAARLRTPARLALTALTAQGRRFRAQSASRFLDAQLESALSRGPLGAVKLGMVPDRAGLDVLRQRLWRLRVPKVVDPVVLTSKGERLSSLSPDDYLSLAAPGVVLTPNEAEAEWLGGVGRMLAAGFEAVLVKGGASGIDVLHTPAGPRAFRGRPLRRTFAHRGTGCRFATALACSLAAGAGLEASVRAAKGLVRKFLSQPIIDQL